MHQLVNHPVMTLYKNLYRYFLAAMTLLPELVASPQLWVKATDEPVAKPAMLLACAGSCFFEDNHKKDNFLKEVPIGEGQAEF